MRKIIFVAAKPWAVRGDGALYPVKLIEKFEEQNLVYAISAQMNAALRVTHLRLVLVLDCSRVASTSTNTSTNIVRYRIHETQQ